MMLSIAYYWMNECLVAQSYLTICDSMDYSLPHSSVCWIFQARILEWIAISFSRGSSRSRNQTQVSGITGRLFTDWTMKEAPHVWLILAI